MRKRQTAYVPPPPPPLLPDLNAQFFAHVQGCEVRDLVGILERRDICLYVGDFGQPVRFGLNPDQRQLVRDELSRRVRAEGGRIELGPVALVSHGDAYKTVLI